MTIAQIASTTLTMDQALAGQSYHDAQVYDLATPGGFPWPRALVRGYVISHTTEPDGDGHFNLAATDNGTVALNATIRPRIICEIVPQWPLNVPPLHALIDVWGIPRHDDGHDWGELHPVWWWQLVTP